MNKVIFEPVEHTYSIGDKFYPSFSEIAKHFGMTLDYDRWGNDASKNFGSAVHEVTRLYDLGIIDKYEYDPRIEPWLDGYKKFLDVYKPKWELIEKPMVSTVWGFAGTPDRFGRMKLRNDLIDFKTGSETPYHALQTAAYQVLVEENLKVKVQRRHSLYIYANDFRLIPHDKRSDRTIFLGLAQAYNWKLRNKLIKE